MASQHLPVAPHVVHGTCYCGGVKFAVDCTATAPLKALYCHCESCRRAHAAPLYQVVYGEQLLQGHRPWLEEPGPTTLFLQVFVHSREHTVRSASCSFSGIVVGPAVARECMKIVEGEDLVTQFRKTRFSPTRSFCRCCGSRVQNILNNEGIPDSEQKVGFFPALLAESTQHDLPLAFRPTRHSLAEETVLHAELLPNLIDPVLEATGETA